MSTSPGTRELWSKTAWKYSQPQKASARLWIVSQFSRAQGALCLLLSEMSLPGIRATANDSPE
jgi:hypothetical protein